MVPRLVPSQGREALSIMERRTELQEPESGRTLEQEGNGYAAQSLSAREQFSTRSCARCAGLLVHDWCNDVASTDENTAHALRCIQCGHRIDPVILLNQSRPADEAHRVQRPRQRQSLRTATLA